MRIIQRQPLLRVLVALLVSSIAAWVMWHVGRLALLIGMVVPLTLLIFLALTIAPDAIAAWRGHSWRWWWRTSDDEGPFWPGTRIPRHP